MAVRLWRNNTYLDEYLNTEVRTCAKTNNCISMYLYMAKSFDMSSFKATHIEKLSGDNTHEEKERVMRNG